MKRNPSRNVARRWGSLASGKGHGALLRAALYGQFNDANRVARFFRFDEQFRLSPDRLADIFVVGRIMAPDGFDFPLKVQAADLGIEDSSCFFWLHAPLRFLRRPPAFQRVFLRINSIFNE